MPSSFVIRLGRRQTASLAIAVGLTLATAAIAAIVATASGGRVGAWCRDMLALGVAGMRTIPIAIASVSALAVAAVLVREGLAVRRLRRELAARAIPLPGKVLAALAAIDAPDAMVTAILDARTFAYTFGIVSPRVVVSSGLVSRFTREELKAVLRHELRHAADRHPLRAFLWEVACRAFFFLPVLRDVADHLALARELDADRDALLGRGGQRTLASALLKTAPRATALPTALAAFGHLKGRIEALSGAGDATISLGIRRSFVSILALVAVAVVTALPARAEARDPTEGVCRTVLVEKVRSIAGPMSSAFPSGPSSTEGDLQSREIAP